MSFTESLPYDKYSEVVTAHSEEPSASMRAQHEHEEFRNRDIAVALNGLKSVPTREQRRFVTRYFDQKRTSMRLALGYLGTNGSSDK